MRRFFKKRPAADPELAHLPMELLPPPNKPTHRLAILLTANRYDATPLANGVMRAAATREHGGAACQVVYYSPDDHESCAA